MGFIPQVSYIDIRIPHAVTEQEFLRLAVQAAARKSRELQADASSPVRRPGAEIIATPVRCRLDEPGRGVGRTDPEILRRDEQHIMTQLPELISRVSERTHDPVDLRQPGIGCNDDFHARTLSEVLPHDRAIFTEQ